MLKIAGLTCIVAGVLALGHSPTRYAAHSGASSASPASPASSASPASPASSASPASPARPRRQARGFVIMGIYIVMIGAASVFYFLGLRGLPVSLASAASNTSVIVTVVLSAIFLHQPLGRARGAELALTLLGATLLALSTG